MLGELLGVPMSIRHLNSPLLAFAIAIALAGAGGLAATSIPEARAQAAEGPLPANAKPLQGIDRLEAEEYVRDRIASYALLYDGDGLKEDRAAWAATTYWPDAHFILYDQSGVKVLDVGGAAAIFQLFGRSGPRPSTSSQRHGLFNVYFEELTQNQVRTKTVEYLVNGVKGPPAPGEQQVALPHYIFHDTWARSSADPRVWRKTNQTVYCIANC